MRFRPEVSIHVDSKTEIFALSNGSTSVLRRAFLEPSPGAELEGGSQLRDGLGPFRANATTEQVVRFNHNQASKIRLASSSSYMSMTQGARGCLRKSRPLNSVNKVCLQAGGPDTSP